MRPALAALLCLPLASCLLTEGEVDYRIDTRMQAERAELLIQFGEENADAIDQAVEDARDGVERDIEALREEREDALTQFAESIPGIITDPVGGSLAAIMGLLGPAIGVNMHRDRRRKKRQEPV